MREEIIARLQELPNVIHDIETKTCNTSLAVQEAKDGLCQKEATLLLSGKIDGKNAEQRQAQLNALTLVEREKVTGLEKQLAGLRTDLNYVLNQFKAYRSIAAILGGEING